MKSRLRTVEGTPVHSAESPRLARLRAGDERACEELVRAHGGALLALARRLLGDERAAAAALEEGFLAAFRAPESCPEEGALAAWLRGKVIEACVARLGADEDVPLAELLPAFDARGNHSRAVPAAADPVARGAPELQAELRRCLTRLPAGHRVALLLCDVERLPADEVGARLGLTRAALAARVHEARQALLTLLAPALASK